MIVLFARVADFNVKTKVKKKKVTLDTCADKANALVRGGTSQLDRYLQELDPSYIAVNEKNRAQWLAFTANMANYLNYYNSQNNKNGNWAPFFNYDLVNYAKISLQNAGDIQTYFNQLLAILRSSEADYTAQQRLDAFTTICFSIFTLCGFIDGQLTATQNAGYTNQISGLISGKLKQPLARLLSYFKFANEHFLSGNLITTNPPMLFFGNQASSNPDSWKSEVKSSLWFSPAADISDYFTNYIQPDQTIFVNQWSELPTSYTSSSQIWQCLFRASRHSLFTSIITSFLNACTFIQGLNAQLFESTLSTGQLPPHLCLYFTFLTMLEQAQNDLNLFTERHLNFFYENVLQLTPNPAQPNQAHVTVQISKNLDEYLIPAGTLFNAGKDDTGVNVSYSLLRDTVFNHATVASLKSFYIAGQSDRKNLDNNISSAIINQDKAFASSVANSSDGVGGNITATPPAWQPFGNKYVATNGDVTMLMPLANLGFAIGSQYLYLQEGSRTINIIFGTDTANSASAFSGITFNCQLTTPSTKTGWTATANPVTATPGTDKNNNPIVTFSITLDPKFPPVGGYSTALNGPSIQTDVPVIQFTLIDNNFAANGLFASLQSTAFTSCTVSVTVGNPLTGPVDALDFNGLKTLYLSNDTGPIDASKPFSPFGSPAQKNASFNIGCRELFLKPSAQWFILTEHTGIPDYSNPPSNSKPYTENGSTSKTPYPMWYAGSPIYFVDYSTVDPIATPAPPLPAGANPPLLTLGYLSGGSWTDYSALTYPLNFTPSLPAGSTVGPQFGVLASNPPGINGGAAPLLPVIDYKSTYKPFNQATTDGFLRVSLTNDFGYNDYVQALIQYRIEQSPTTTPPAPEFEPVQPYAPLIKSISVNYSASVTLDLTPPKQGDTTQYAFNQYVNYYYIYPFGAAELTFPVSASQALTNGANFGLANTSQYQAMTLNNNPVIWVPIGNVPWSNAALTGPPPVPSFFPPFNGAGANSLTQSFISEFYIGLSNIEPGENVNLLFQVVDGTTNPLLSKPSQQIYWYYLSDNHWKAFAAGEVIDNTMQFIQSGVITFQLPYDATLQNTLLPAGYIWLKAGLTSDPDAICQLISILPQAALVQFVNNGNSPDFLQNQIPSGTITKLVKPLGPVKQIAQPFQSFGGLTAESTPSFRVRVSERLRHKDRAIQIWDYEHLILQNFSTIQKVKCLNHTEYNPGANNKKLNKILYSEQAPGHVTIVTIPYVQQSNSANLLKPYTDVATLANISKFIGTRVSQHVTLHVENPIFEEIQLSLSVNFNPGLDNVYYSNLLNQQIVKFLSPWAFTDQADISFGGTVYKSTIINFIENLSYINYITNVSMYCTPYGASQPSADQDTVTAANGISVLVSAPQHIITAVSNTNS